MLVGILVWRLETDLETGICWSPSQGFRCRVLVPGLYLGLGGTSIINIRDAGHHFVGFKLLHTTCKAEANRDLCVCSGQPTPQCAGRF